MSKLDEEQWRTILELSELTADLPAGERLSYLESVCSSPEMVREVLSVVQEFHPAAAVTSRVGSRIGRFTITGYVGSGGVGDVYSATDSELGRTVALKFLTPAAGEQTGALERFIREARTASALNHANIVTVHEIIHSETAVAIVMEYVEGKALRQLCGMPIRIEQTLRIGRQIALALAAAHSGGIVHRDIKPENVIVRSDGSLKVLDFGLATWVAAQGQNSIGLSSSHLFAGTWRYMSPEQANGEATTSATDIFSLGLVLYELSIGKRPYASESLEDRRAPSTRARPLPFQRHASLPKSFDRLIAGMLASEAIARPTAANVAEELADLERQQNLSPRSMRGPLPAAISALLLTICSVAYVVFTRAPSSRTPLLPVPISVDPGYKWAPSFSPDGKRIAYQWDRPGSGSRVYVQDIPSEKEPAGEPVRLTSEEKREANPAWSPDGKVVAFIRDERPGMGSLLLADLQSHQERKLTEMYGGWVSWTPDGKWLLASENRIGHLVVVLISPATGKRRMLTNPAPNERDEQPSITADGRRLVFVMRLFGDEGHLAQLALDREYNPIGRPTLLGWQTFRSAIIDNPIWTANGRDLLFIAAPDGIRRVWRSRDGAQPELVNDLGENVSGLALSPGQRLAYSRDVDDTNIWKLDLKRLESGNAISAAATEIISSSRMDQRPATSPDGTKLAYESNRSGFTEIWLSTLKDGQSWPVTHIQGLSGSPRWSHDGKWIVFDSRTESTSKLFKILSSGGEPLRLTAGDATDQLPVWGADDKLIYFSSNRSGKFQIWAVSANGGSAAPVTKSAGTAPEISPDGQSLYYLEESYAPSTLWRRGLSSGASSLIAHDVSFRDLTIGKKALYYMTQGDLAIHALDQKSGHIRTLGKLSRNTVGGMSLSPDERYLYFAELDHSGDELMLVNNFQ